MFEIKGKVALITGGASGIGFQYAVELLNNGLKGVTLADINEEFGKIALKDISQKFGDDKAIFVKVDVTNQKQFEDAFKKTVEKFENIDILINNAGILDDRIWETEIDINIKGTVTGTLLAIQNYIHKHKSGPEGVIVNISSVVGVDPAPMLPIYCATKYAIIGFTRSFGTEMHYALSNVRVFAICPGFTDTPLMTNFEVKSLKPEYTTSFKKVKHLVVYQQPADIARHAVELIKTAPQGSVWVIDSNEPPYEYSHIPRQKFKELTANSN
ncbi:hypothetical protein RN001_009274 [Aquatica leii]|uniref:15-hydroxyprostaglandin dehydrogenase [NAD(+)]-like n=1 Tax=Aquatica leii TaxID=1421715 RepID=A0AAN7QG40_9COLE|nr:hypothetical protein RN001_009274 [Aquatica leii]